MKMKQYFNSKNGITYKNTSNINERLKDKFHTANKELTPYSFHCGYIESFDSINKDTGIMDKDSYHSVKIEKVNPSTYMLSYIYRDYLDYPTKKVNRYFYTEKRAGAYKKMYAILNNDDLSNME